jgi:hypothetical protein
VPAWPNNTVEKSTPHSASVNPRIWQTFPQVD